MADAIRQRPIFKRELFLKMASLSQRILFEAILGNIGVAGFPVPINSPCLGKPRGVSIIGRMTAETSQSTSGPRIGLTPDRIPAALCTCNVIDRAL
jgi:hypothetical protein